MITGQDTPDSGEVLTGATVQLAYVDQSRDSLEDGRTVYEEITDGLDIVKVGNRELNGRSYVASSTSKEQINKNQLAIFLAEKGTEYTSEGP